MEDTDFVFEKDKKTRLRVKPPARWSSEEVVGMLKAAKLSGDKFELPTARIYYDNLVRKLKLTKTWQEARDKFKNLRMQYKKALHFMKDKGDLESEQKPEIRGTPWRSYVEADLQKSSILNICPFYDELLEISENKAAAVGRPSRIDTDRSNHIDETAQATQEIEYLDNEGVEGFIINPFCQEEEISPRKVKRKAKLTSNSAAMSTTDLQAKKIALRAQKLNLKRQMFEFQKSCRLEELEIKKRKIENKQELAKFKISENIRLKEMELNLKYKNQV